MDQPLLLYCEYPDAAAITATDTYAGHDVDDVRFPTEDLTWRPADNVGTKDVVIDWGAAVSHEAVALLGEYLDGITLEVRASTDNFVASDVQLLAGTVLNAGINAAWQKLTSTGDYRYTKIRFSNFSTTIEIGHLCVAPFEELPWLSDDFDPENLKVEGSHLLGSAKHYTGSVRKSAVAELTLDFGQVFDSEYLIIKAWRDACLMGVLPFFFVPESADDTVFFAWIDDIQFSAPRPNGVRAVMPITMETRVA